MYTRNPFRSITTVLCGSILNRPAFDLSIISGDMLDRLLHPYSIRFFFIESGFKSISLGTNAAWSTGHENLFFTIFHRKRFSNDRMFCPSRQQHQQIEIDSSGYFSIKILISSWVKISP
jgi:hypothetical protein